MFGYILGLVALTVSEWSALIIIIRISHFSALAGKYSPILGYFINRVRLGGLMCNLGNFLQLNMCQELLLLLLLLLLLV
jgi:hypothetical protein